MIFRNALQNDLPVIVEIYNSNVAGRMLPPTKMSLHYD